MTDVVNGKMSSQLVSLAWDGHHKTLVSVFEKLLVNSHFVDCTIAAEGQKMKAHKEVLSAFSPFFKLLFKEESENNPTVIISGISFKDLRSLVDFIYRGKLEVTEDRIQDLIDAAECLQIEGLGGGCKEDDSRNINNTTMLPRKPALSSGIPHKRTRRCESEETAFVDSKENEVNNLNYNHGIRPENSVAMRGVAMQSSPVQNLVSNSEVQNVDIVSNISLMPAQTTLSEIEMDRLHLQGEYVVKKEPDSDGEENINEPMRDTSENTGEESILGLSADISVPSEKNVYEHLPLDCVPPAVLSSELCSRDLTGSFVKNEPSNLNVTLSSESEDRVVSADTQDPLFHSNFHMKSEDETLLSVDNDLINENDEFLENVPQSIGVTSFSEMQMEKQNDCSGAASGCILESTYSPQELPTGTVKIQRTGCYEPVVGLISGIPAKDNPTNTPIHPTHTTPLCGRGLPGPSGSDVSNGSSSTDRQFRCQICDQTFARNHYLNSHMRIHADRRLIRNDECNNAVGTSIKLKNLHVKSGRKLYKCTVCDFKSVHHSSLSVHMRIHSGVKPYKCPKCEYTSAYSYHLKRHLRSHNGVKPYKCEECDYTAVSSCSINKHKRTHSGVKPFKCSECDYTSALSSNVSKHKRIHSVGATL